MTIAEKRQLTPEKECSYIEQDIRDLTAEKKKLESQAEYIASQLISIDVKISDLRRRLYSQNKTSTAYADAIKNLESLSVDDIKGIYVSYILEFEAKEE